MSWSKIADLDTYLLQNYGDGIEEIVLSEQSFNSLLRDAYPHKKFDYIDLETQQGKSVTNIKFHTQNSSITVTKSNKLERLKTRNY